MQLLRYLAASVYGFALVYFVCIWLAGVMAARQVPADYFRYFGAYGHFGKEIGLGLLSFAQHLVPTVCLLIVGVLLPARLASSKRRQVGLAVVVGGLASYLFWLAFYSWQGTGGVLSLQQLLAVFQVPWWAVPGAVGPVVGIAVAYALLHKLLRRPAEA